MKKILGILGGMGPQATIDFQQKIYNLTVAGKDQGHMRIITDNHPQIPDRTQAILGDGHSPAPLMQESLDKLVRAGAQIIAMPCVTAHYFLPALNVPPTVEFLNIIDIVTTAANACFAEKTGGILCTKGTARSGMFSKAYEAAGLRYIMPNEEQQSTLSELIAGVKAKGGMGSITRRFEGIASEMAGIGGADYFVLACTEIPIIAAAYDFAHPFIDVTSELAKAAIRACGYDGN